MKISSLIVPAACVLVLFAACEQETRPKKRTTTTSENRFPVPTPGTADGFVGDENATPPPTPSPTPDGSTISPAPSPTPTTTSSNSGSIPYATPVPGKPGHVISPYAPYAGYVDVRGFATGMEAKCPFSGKIFLVP
jgi:hypothetical protein